MNRRLRSVICVFTTLFLAGLFVGLARWSAANADLNTYNKSGPFAVAAYWSLSRLFFVVAMLLLASVVFRRSLRRWYVVHYRPISPLAYQLKASRSPKNISLDQAPAIRRFAADLDRACPWAQPAKDGFVRSGPPSQRDRRRAEHSFRGWEPADGAQM